MGQAKRRNGEGQKWQASLSPEEKAVADAAQRFLQRLIDPSEATGMCYRLTFFLHLYLLDILATNPRYAGAVPTAPMANWSIAGNAVGKLFLDAKLNAAKPIVAEEMGQEPLHPASGEGIAAVALTA